MILSDMLWWRES